MLLITQKTLIQKHYPIDAPPNHLSDRCRCQNFYALRTHSPICRSHHFPTRRLCRPHSHRLRDTKQTTTHQPNQCRISQPATAPLDSARVHIRSTCVQESPSTCPRTRPEMKPAHKATQELMFNTMGTKKKRTTRRPKPTMTMAPNGCAFRIEFDEQHALCGLPAYIVHRCRYKDDGLKNIRVTTNIPLPNPKEQKNGQKCPESIGARLPN